MEKRLFLYTYVLLFPFFFFSSPLIFPLVAATSIYHFLIVLPLLFFLYFFQRNWSPLFFISRSSSFSLIHVNRVIDSQCQRKLSRRTDDFLNWSKNQIFLPILLLFKNAKAKAWALIGLSLLWGGTLRPVSNFVLLPCRTQLIELNSTLARQSLRCYTALAWLGFKHRATAVPNQEP